MSVVLLVPQISATNNSRRLGISMPGKPNNADGSLSLTLTKDGTWQSFYVDGRIGSDNTNDAKIEVHKDTSAGDIKKTAGASVYWFKDPHMSVTQGGTYQLNNPAAPTLYGVNSTDIAVDLQAELTLLPAGVSTTVPGLADLGVGFVQNLSNPSYVVNWTSPLLQWTPQARAGDIVTQGIDFSETHSFAGSVNDTNGGDAPLYTSSSPISSSGISTRCNSNDKPQLPVVTTATAPVNINGRHVADITYQVFTKATITASFTDWCVTYHTPSKSIRSYQKENSWSLMVDSSKNDQKAAVGTEHSVSSSPNLSTTVFANDLINDAANLSRLPSGTKITWYK